MEVKQKYEELFKKIANAYETLNNEEKKDEYNATLSNENYDEIPSNIHSSQLLNGKRKSDEINKLFEQYCNEYKLKQRGLPQTNQNNDIFDDISNENQTIFTKNYCQNKVLRLLNNAISTHADLNKFLSQKNIFSKKALKTFDKNTLFSQLNNKNRLQDKYFDFISKNTFSKNVTLNDIIKQLETKVLSINNVNNNKFDEEMASVAQNLDTFEENVLVSNYFGKEHINKICNELSITLFENKKSDIFLCDKTVINGYLSLVSTYIRM